MAGEDDMRSLVENVAGMMASGEELFDSDMEELFQQKVLDRPEADGELIALLPTLIPRGPKDEALINAALDILSWLLGELRMELERGGEGPAARMESLQDALARHVFSKEGDAGLCAAVGRALLESRVEILPPIHEANRVRLMGAGEGDAQVDPADIASILGESLLETGISDPFDAFDHILELIGLLEPGYQSAIAKELLSSDVPLAREIAPLMLFHPRSDVCSAVAAMISRAKGEGISPETLRRLIMVRNWFSSRIRSAIDKAVSAARRAGVECAPLGGKIVHFIYATTIDGAGTQSFWMAVGERNQVKLCNVLWKQGGGVMDTFVHGLPSVQAADRFMKGLPGMMCFAEVDSDYLDKAIGCALAAGAEHGSAPHRGLLRIAEFIGCDRWKGTPFDAGREISRLRKEVARNNGGVDPSSALEDSVDWPAVHDFADTWFEDDALVDRIVFKAMKGRGKNREVRAVDGILAEVLEPRRGVWLERLLLMTLWLKSAATPPVPWQRMFHLADALYSGIPMKEIPLMMTVAEVTFAMVAERDWA